MKKLINLVENLYIENKPILIWCQYIDSMEEIMSILKSKGIESSVICGYVDNVDREKIIDDFNWVTLL